jgi:hypothetical protein
VNALARTLVGFAVLLSLTLGTARAADFIVGVNVVNPLRASVADQNALIAQLKAAGVRVIRCGVTPDAKGLDFAKRVYAAGIRIQLILSLKYDADAPTRPYDPRRFPNMWGGHPLSSASVTLSKAYFESLVGMFDANGMTLAGLELGNEINWAAFNPEFPLPGEGKILTRADLANDPEGQQIARGFRQYVKVLAALKNVRDHSPYNARTPIVLAGLVAAEDGGKPFNTRGEDMVSLPATIGFLRENGLDAVVDYYGIHTYPSASDPGDPAAAAKRAERFTSVDLAECRSAGSPDGKPCWITEWGFPNSDVSCPPDDAKRTELVEEMRADFARAADQGRLVGASLFSWDSDPWSKHVDFDSVYRCGELTSSGRAALQPLPPN